MVKQKRYAARLPSGYNKAPESVNERLLALPGMALIEASVDLQAVADAADLEKATGQTLDLFGRELRVARGALDDTQYRFLIKSRAARNFVGGDIESVTRGVLGMFGAKPGEVELTDDPEDSGVAWVRRLPFAILQKAGFTGKQAVQIVQELLPAGVRLLADNFEGSFAFAQVENEYTKEQGFADHDDPKVQTMGGFLGFVLGDDTAAGLPLL